MQNYVELKHGEYILRGFMHKPDKIQKKIPLAIFFHGYSASKTDFWFVEASRQLEIHGIASLRFDFMGSGDSDGRFQDMSVETEISDGIAILRYAQSLSYIDANRIALVGMSFGGLVASIIAGRLSSDIGALCMWAPAIIAIQDAKDGRAGNTDISSALTTGTADINGLLVGKRFVEDTRNLDFEVEASQYKKNTIIIWGDQDPIVPSDVIYKCELVYGKRLEKCMIEGVGHMFETRSARIKQLEATIRFIKKELQG